MEEAITIAGLLTEMDDLGRKISEKGVGVLSNPGVKSDVTRILAHYAKSHKCSIPTDPNSVIDALGKFRTVLKDKLVKHGLNLKQGQRLRWWVKGCRGVIESVGVYVTGKGVFSDDKIKNLKVQGDRLLHEGRIILRLDGSFTDGVWDVYEDLHSSLKYLDKKPYNLDPGPSLPEPLGLSGENQNPFEGICVPTVSSADKSSSGILSLTQRRSQKLVRDKNRK